MTVGAAAHPLALTMGEPAGVGGELSLKAWLARSRVQPFFVIDDAARLRRLAGVLDLDVPVCAIDAPKDAVDVFQDALPVLSRPLPHAVAPGHPDPANASAVLGAIREAVGFARDGSACAVVTNPIHKKVLADSGFPHPGHTEFLGELTDTESPVMMLACPDLRVIPVTVHLPLREAIATLSTDRIVLCGRVAAKALRVDFAIPRPRLAIAGLNPHAGEQGMLGTEEETIIAPAVEALKAEGIDVTGPAPADSLFHPRARNLYDAVLCMYHDQALIPLKTIDFDHGVDITLGLPVVRTSPDHGTAFDIAGQGLARVDSLLCALSEAAVMAANRATANSRISP